MRAVVHTRYGPPDVLRLEQVERPAPRDGELRVTVHATTVNRTDCGLRNAEPVIVRPFSGLLRPRRRILGTELAGLVEAIGSAVTEFQVGDRVFGVNANRFGAHAEYVCVAQGAPIATMPSNMSFVQAAAVCHGAILALTAVCNTTSLDTIRSLGTGAVIDHTREDFTGNGETYDVVFDAVGKLTFARCRGSLVDGGVFMSTDLGPHWQNPVLALLTSRSAGRRVLFPIPRYTQEDVLFLRGLIEVGSYRAVIDRRYPLEEVIDATRYVETEQKMRNVVLEVIPECAQT